MFDWVSILSAKASTPPHYRRAEVSWGFGLISLPKWDFVIRVANKQTSKLTQLKVWSENSCKAPPLAREAVLGAFSSLSGFACLFISNSKFCRTQRKPLVVSDLYMHINMLNQDTSISEHGANSHWSYHSWKLSYKAKKLAFNKQ